MRFALHHVAISVTDLDRAVEFYQKLGFEKKSHWHDDTLHIVHMRLADQLLEIFHHPNSQKPLPNTARELGTDLPVTGAKHFALRVQDIHEAKDYLVKKGLASTDITINKGRSGPFHLFFISDPDGILIEIIQDDGDFLA